MRVTPRSLASMVTAVARVAPIRPMLTSAAVVTAYALASPNADAAASRLRVGCAIVAASVAFVLDDDAAATVAATPVTRLQQRAARVGLALTGLAGWVAVVAFAADALTGVGRPPNGVLLEVGAVALVALAAACLAIGRTDDGRGGIAGAVVALVCFATSYVPVRWWLPFTAEPHTARLLTVSAAALAVALWASADPARRRGRIG